MDIVIDIFVPGKPEFLGTHEFSGVRFGLVARIVQDLHIVRHLSSATHAHSKILTKCNIVGKVLKKGSSLSHLVNPQDLHMASFPGILFDNWPEPEPPLEEAGQSVDFIKLFFVHHCVLKASKVLVRNLLAQESLAKRRHT